MRNTTIHPKKRRSLIRVPAPIITIVLLTAVITTGAMLLSCRYSTISQNDKAPKSATKYGLECPAASPDEHIVEYDGFTVSYNHTTLVPDWVAYQLTAKELEPVYTNKSSNFSRDPNLKGRQASREDYSRSGWDKGHMAPKADLRWSEAAYWQSHYFTNVCPQNPTLNGRDWNKLEESIRRWAKKYGDVYIVCGPLFHSAGYRTIGAAKVAIPDAFFKAVLVANNTASEAIAFVFNNDDSHQPPIKQAMTVDSLETILSRDLFPKLDDETEVRVEASMNLPFWFTNN